MLRSGKFHDGPMQYSLTKILGLKPRFGLPSWPQVEAQIVKVTRTTSANIPLSRNTPDGITVAYTYHVNGANYQNRFVVIASPQDWFWQGQAAANAPEEMVRVRYDPSNPADSCPVEKTWHEFKVWSWG